MALIDEAVGIATGLVAGTYRGLEDASNEGALRALRRRVKGSPRAERRVALDRALGLVHASMTLYESRNIWSPPDAATHAAMVAELAAAFPEFAPSSHEAAYNWGILWYCK